MMLRAEAAVSQKRTLQSVATMFDSIAWRYDITNTVLSFGLDALWRRALLQRAFQLGYQRVLDLCCGSGSLSRQLAVRGSRVPREYPEVVAVDCSLGMLRQAKPPGGFEGQVYFSLADAERLPFKSEEFDLVTVGFGVRNMCNLKGGLLEIGRVLKPGGSVLILEFGTLRANLSSRLFSLYGKTLMPLVGAILTGNREAYRYLHRSIMAFPAGEAFEEILTESGFTVCQSSRLTGSVAFLYWVKRGDGKIYG